jgi:carboxylesterase
MLFNRGHNVLVPRLPYHGLADRMTRELRLLTAGDLQTLALESMAAAQALAERVRIVGFSLGGTLAAWLSQRVDLDSCLLVAPMFGIWLAPPDVNRLFMKIGRQLPSFDIWWDPRLRADYPPSHVYPRFASHAVASMLALSLDVRMSAVRQPPRAATIKIITNANDRAVNNVTTHGLVEAWRRLGLDVEAHEFSRSLHLPHDLIDPDNPRQNVHVVYPTVLRMAL